MLKYNKKDSIIDGFLESYIKTTTSIITLIRNNLKKYFLK